MTSSMRLSVFVVEMWCDLFSIDSKQNEMYKHALREGLKVEFEPGGLLSLDETIIRLASNLPDTEPYRTRAICQLRGYCDARKRRAFQQ